MQAACEDGEAILGLDKDVLTKQKELKTILMVYELEQEHFQGVNIDIVSDANIDAPNSRDVVEETVIEDIMRLEFKNAARNATCEAATLVKNAMFSVSDVNAVLELTRAKARVRYKRHILEAMNEKNPTAASTTMQTDLRACELAVVKQGSVLKRAQKTKFLQDRKRELETQKTHKKNM